MRNGHAALFNGVLELHQGRSPDAAQRAALAAWCAADPGSIFVWLRPDTRRDFRNSSSFRIA